MSTDTDYGRDISCTDSLGTGRFVTRARLVAEACYRRLRTPRGQLRGGEEEANYGLDLSALCGASNPDSVAASLPGRISAELEKDERVLKVDVDVFKSTVGAETSFTITITASTSEGPFTLKVLASAVTVAKLGIEA